MRPVVLFLLILSPLFSSPFGECHDPFEFDLKPSDKFQFGRLWQQIKRIKTEEELEGLIKERRAEIKEQKEHWRPKISLLLEGSSHPFYCELNATLAKGKIVPSESGCGGAYILSDEFGNPHFIIKPVDEDILCINNRKHFSSPYNGKAFRVRTQIPLYRSAQTEGLAYEIAVLLQSAHLTPKTTLAIVEHEGFYDIGASLSEDARKALYSRIGPPDKEKLCSVQRFLPHERNLLHLIQEWVDVGQREVIASIEQEEFENLMLYIWCIHDTDAHVGNFPIIPDGEGHYRLKKIDNGLSFPEKNSHLFNVLYFLPQAKTPITERLRNKIEALPMQAMEEKIRFYEMDDCLKAFQERIAILKELSTKNYTLAEIDMRLHALELPDGKEFALGDRLLAQLENLVIPKE